ncbi:gaba-B receptor, putative, partial [Ixodes scapularis]
LTYADTHPMYTLESYPNFFRVVPSESVFNQARVSLLKHFNWTRVGTLYQTNPRYALVSDDDLAPRVSRPRGVCARTPPDFYGKALTAAAINTG